MGDVEEEGQPSYQEEGEEGVEHGVGERLATDEGEGDAPSPTPQTGIGLQQMAPMLATGEHGNKEHHGLKDDNHQHGGDEVDAIAFEGVVEWRADHRDGGARGYGGKLGKGEIGHQLGAVLVVHGLHDLQVGGL